MRLDTVRAGAGSAQGGPRSPAPSGAGRPGRREGHRGIPSDKKAGRTVRHGAPDTFTSVSHPGMGPTNNAAERALRRMAMRMGIRHGLRTAGGMRMFGTTMTCTGTCRMRGLDVAEKLREVLAAA